MKEVKIYTIVSDQLSPPITGESFCTDMVRHSDYAELEAKYAVLTVDNDKAMESLKQADSAVKLAHEKFSALAAENAGLKHAMAVTLEHVSVTDAGQAGVAAMIINDALHHGETPATDAFLDEVRASGVDAAIEHLHKKFGGTGHIGVPVMALEWLAQEIRKGGAA
ncbi:TPA: hypothetical protein G9B32_000692 [Salmonella enterica]|uniref:Eae-like protein n=1 Tax=Salmonella enterica TaxID=28901 RepID=A0A750BNF7_SALER|nr:hypothetical protein [Salmonella enterica]HAF6139507.1 hypothetical protein [Salmonella enterica]